MSVRFERDFGLVMVPVKLWGPRAEGVLNFALDTGATNTVVGTASLVTLGYDPALEPDRVQVTTGSSVEFVSRVVVDRIVALDQERTRFPVLCHTLPTSAGVDGLLGLDFLRDLLLEVDFRSGEITLS